MLPEPDRIRLQHMLDAAREAMGYVRGKTREDLDRDSIMIHAYFDISRDVVWSTITHDLALLEPQLTTILAANGAGA